MFLDRWIKARIRDTEPVLAPKGVSIRQTPVLLTAPGKAMKTKKFLGFSDKPLVAVRIKIFKPKKPPMVRVIFDDGSASEWHELQFKRRRPVAIETCAPDNNGHLRYAQHKIG